jgi:hypothetical protein
MRKPFIEKITELAEKDPRNHPHYWGCRIPIY